MEYRYPFAEMEELKKLAPISSKADEAMRGLWAKLEKAAARAFDAGKDFAVEKDVKFEGPDIFSPFSIWEPVRYGATVKAGPVMAGSPSTAIYTVYRRPDDWETNPLYNEMKE